MRKELMKQMREEAEQEQTTLKNVLDASIAKHEQMLNRLKALEKIIAEIAVLEETDQIS